VILGKRSGLSSTVSNIPPISTFLSFMFFSPPFPTIAMYVLYYDDDYYFLKFYFIFQNA
jgi:hypothetical protein